MLRYFYFLFILISANIFLFPAPANAQSVTTGKTYAVITGIKNYQNPSIPGLDYADKDATMFAAYLKTKAGGLVPDDHIKLLTNEEATIAAVYQAIDWLKGQAKKGDLIYFYFSGHGDVEIDSAKISRGYLLAYNSPANNYANNAIRVEDINNDALLLTTKNQAKVILITDACRSGKLAGDFYKGKQLTANNLRAVLNNQVRLASCQADELAAEGPNWGGGRGVFSFYLLKGLTGETEPNKKGVITKEYLDTFLLNSFKRDKYLISEKHQQHPVLDGNDFFPLAIIDTLNTPIIAAKKEYLLPAALLSFGQVGPQPIDHFFELFKANSLDTALSFKNYLTLAPDSIPITMTNDFITFQKNRLKELEKDSLPPGSFSYYSDPINKSLTSLTQLAIQLTTNKSLSKRFIEKYITYVHEKAQGMINAYLEGDLSELEKRQYYYTGKYTYADFLQQLMLAKILVPDHNHLSRILTVQYHYLHGLLERLKMEISLEYDSLLQKAFTQQYKALHLEPYAPYINNEIGNLYLFKKSYDSAAYYFKMASILAPTWAIPWSNTIKLNLTLNNIPEAKVAIRIADSLQSNLAYIKTNSGLVMERDGNLLSASSYYLQAIALNNAHYLPYERLGFIYLQTGDFGKANYYFYETKRRKENFNINDEIFKQGLSLSVQFPEFVPETDYCPLTDTANIEAMPYLNLEKGLRFIKKGNVLMGKKLIKEALLLNPDLPLAHHYLAKIDYDSLDWQIAESLLLIAIKNYKQKNILKEELNKSLNVNNHTNLMNCLVEKILDYHYEETEDRYLLGKLYETKGYWNEALRQYHSITVIENERLVAEASYNHFTLPVWSIADLAKVDADTARLLKSLEEKFQSAPFTGGYYKAAMLYEKMGQYHQAEKILLNQMQLVKTAGDIRFQATTEIVQGNTSAIYNDNPNYYWRLINKDIEALTYNFYNRMLTMDSLNPDPLWNEKAGLFLYNRLALSFNQLPVKEQHLFYESILLNLPDIESITIYALAQFYESMTKYPYPWLNERRFEEQMVRFNFPGTNEQLVINAPIFNPVQKAVSLIEKAIKYSGELLPGRELMTAMADLYSWTNQSNKAISIYYNLVKQTASDAALRNKLIDNLITYNRLPEAAVQLDSLYNRKQLKSNQVPLTATYHLFSGKNKKAMEVVTNYIPANANESNDLMTFYVKKYWLEANPGRALAYLLDSFPKTEFIKKRYSEKISSTDNDQPFFRMYSIVRNYAVQNNNQKAITYLKVLLDSGFRYNYVLENDGALAKLRKTSSWEALIKKYSFDIDYKELKEKELNNYKWFKIPLIDYSIGRGRR